MKISLFKTFAPVALDSVRLAGPGRMVVAALITMTLVACADKTEDATAMIAQAEARLAGGDAAGARDLAARAVSLRDDIDAGWRILGRAELELGNLSEAYRAYSRALELAATDPEALQMSSELAFQLGDARRADQIAERIMLLNPAATRAIAIRGLVALDRRDLEIAQEFADQLLEIDPADEIGTVIAARVIAIKGDYAAAAALIENNIPSERRQAPSLRTLIELYRELGRVDPLIAAFEQSIAQAPNDQDLKLDLADILYKSGRPQPARKLLLEVMFEASLSGDVARRILALWSRYDKSPLAPADVAKAGSGTAGQRAMVARWLLVSNRPGEAIEVLARAAPSDSEAAALRATAVAALGRRDEALRQADGILEDDPRNIDALVLRSRLYLEKGDTGSAIRDAQLAVNDAPGFVQARIGLAQALAASGNSDRARQTFEDAVNDLPQNLEILRAFVTYLLKTGTGARALSAARNFTEINPSLVAGWDVYRLVCEQLQNPCTTAAAKGENDARVRYTVDEVPGAMQRRGIFGKI